MDSHLRDLERRYRHSRTPADAWAWERDLLRSGMDPELAEVKVYGFASTWVLGAHIGIRGGSRKRPPPLSLTMHVFSAMGVQEERREGWVQTVCGKPVGLRATKRDGMRAIWVPLVSPETGFPEERAPCGDCRLCGECVRMITRAPEPQVRDLLWRLQIASANRVFQAWGLRFPTVDCLRGHPVDRDGSSSFQAEACAQCERKR